MGMLIRVGLFPGWDQSGIRESLKLVLECLSVAPWAGLSEVVWF